MALLKNTWKIKSNRIGLLVAKMLGINSILTLFLFYIVLRKTSFEDLFDVFAISLITALSVVTFAKNGIHFIKSRPKRKDIILLCLWILSGSLAGSFLGSLFFFFRKGMHLQPVLKQVFLYAFVFGIFFEIVFIYFFHSRKKIEDAEKKIQSEMIRRLTLEKESAITNLKLLQAQIEPHFLFNTLSNVASLFETDPEKAIRMLNHLNEYLQITLQRTRRQMITLDQELELIRRYLEIIQIRMGKRLEYEIQKENECGKISLPPMIIHPLVENAVKHGLARRKDGGTIKIICRLDNGRVTITVSDTGPGIDEIEEHRGIGLDNISQRLETIYGDQAVFILKENKPSGLTVTVEVPIE